MRGFRPLPVPALAGIALIGVLHAPLQAGPRTTAQGWSAGTSELPLLSQTGLSQTGQRRSDTIVGHWRSSSGAELTLAYSGRPGTFLIQARPRPGLAQPPLMYTATWLSDSHFVYSDAEGNRIDGRVHPSRRRITVRSPSGWSASWVR